MMCFLYQVAHELCHGGMTGKRGGEVTEVSMNIAGIGTLLFPMEFLCFCGKIPSITPLLMASLHYVIDDVIVTSLNLTQNHKYTCNRF